MRAAPHLGRHGRHPVRTPFGGKDLSRSASTGEHRPSLRAAAESIVRLLQDAGHSAVFAGGCVRDVLLGRRPSDYDVATSAEPSEVLRLFPRSRAVGAKFGVVLVRRRGHSVEVATFRSDADYADGRHPTAVRFSDAREDALRRDFTINGMFYDPLRRQFLDYVGGREDLAAGVIRAIGDPHRRFAEDHLRLLRAIRFAARFGFTIEPATWAAMKAHAGQIRRISPERIREELEGILCHPGRAGGFRHLRDCGLLAHLWPTASEVVPHAAFIEAYLAALPASVSFDAALSVLLDPLPGPGVAAACAALRCSNHTRNTVTWLHFHRFDFDDEPPGTPASTPGSAGNPPRRRGPRSSTAGADSPPPDCPPDEAGRVRTLADLKLRMAHPAFEELLTLFAARLRALDRSPGPHRRALRRSRRIPPAAVAPAPLLTGRDLEQMGVRKGPIYKQVLERVYYLQLNEEISTPAAARAAAREMIP